MDIKHYLKKYVIGTQYEWESHFETIIYLFDKKIKSYEPVNILDVGCGSGDRTIRIANYFNIDLKNCFGLDSNDKNITTCNNYFNAQFIDLEKSNIPIQPMWIHINSDHVRSFTHSGFIEMLKEFKELKLVGYSGALMYPLPYKLAKYLSRIAVGLSGYTCYLLKKTH